MLGLNLLQGDPGLWEVSVKGQVRVSTIPVVEGGGKHAEGLPGELLRHFLCR